jgi:hypothetical protein
MRSRVRERQPLRVPPWHDVSGRGLFPRRQPSCPKRQARTKSLWTFYQTWMVPHDRWRHTSLSLPFTEPLRLARSMRHEVSYSPLEIAMTATAAPPEPLLSADEFIQKYVDAKGVELVEGRLVRLPMPGAKHSEVNMETGLILSEFTRPRGLGRILVGDTFIRTIIDPPSFRGADVVISATVAGRKNGNCPRACWKRRRNSSSR